MSNRELGVEVSMVIDEVMSSLQDLLNAIENLPDETSLELQLNSEEALNDIGEVTQELEDLSGETAEVTLEADDQATDIMGEVESGVEDLDGEGATIELDADNEASTIMDEVKSDMEELDGAVATTDLEANDNASPSIDDVAGSIEELDGMTATPEIDSSGIEGIEGAAESASGSIEGVGGAANTATTELSELGDVGEESGFRIEDAFWEVEASLLGVMVAGELAAQTLNDMLIDTDQLAIMAGISKDDMRNLVNETANVTFPIEDVTKFMKLLIQAGVPTESLKESATHMDIMRDATGMTTAETESLIKAYKVLGADLEDLESVYGAVGYADKNVMGGLPVYIRWMTMFDNTFRDFGFTAMDTAVIIERVSKRFDTGREATTAMRKAIRESNGDSEKFLELLGLTEQDLGKAESKSGDYTQMIKDMAQAEVEHKTVIETKTHDLNELGLSMGNIASEAMSLGAASALSILSLVGIHKVIEKIFGKSLLGAIKNGLLKVPRFLWQQGGKIGGDFLKGIWNGIKTNVVKYLSPSNIVKAIKSILPGAGKGTEKASTSLGGRIVNGIWNGIKSGLPKAIGKIPSFLKSLLGKFNLASIWTTDMFPETVPQGTKGSAEREEWIQEWKRGEHPGALVKTEQQARDYEGSYDTLKKRFDQIKGLYKDFKDWIFNNWPPKIPEIKWGNLGGGLSGTSEWIKGKLYELKLWLYSNIPRIPTIPWGNMTRFLSDSIAWIKQKYYEFRIWLSGIKFSIPTLNWSNLTKWLRDSLEWIKQKIREFKSWIFINKPKIPTLQWGNITKYLKSKIDWVKEKFTELRLFLQGLPKRFKDIGKKIIDALAEGLQKSNPTLYKVLKFIAGYFPESPPKHGPLRAIWYAGAWSDVGRQMAGALQSGYAGEMSRWSASSGQEYPSPARGGTIVIPAPPYYKYQKPSLIAEQVLRYDKIPKTNQYKTSNWGFNQGVAKDLLSSYKMNTRQISSSTGIVSSSASKLGASIGSLAKPMNTLPGLLNNVAKTIKGSATDWVGAYNKTVPTVYVTTKGGPPRGGGAFGDTPSTRSTAKTVGNIYGAVKSIAQELPKGILYGGGGVAKALADAIPTPAMNQALPVGTLYGYGQSVPSTAGGGGNGEVTVEKQEINVNLYDANIRNESDIKKLSKSLAKDIDQQAISRGVRSIDLVR